MKNMEANLKQELGDLEKARDVLLVVEMLPEEISDEILELASQVYKELSDQEVDDIEKIVLNRGGFFREKT